jgi:hypothetical protein
VDACGFCSEGRSDGIPFRLSPLNGHGSVHQVRAISESEGERCVRIDVHQRFLVVCLSRVQRRHRHTYQCVPMLGAVRLSR